jgi:predicted enzyme related to lactoylglutathione lyase
MIDSHGRFVWYELVTTNIEAAKVFYAKVIGWGTQDTSTPGLEYTLFTAGESPIGGLIELPENARKAAGPHWLGYVAVDDVDAAAERIKQLGGAVYVPPTDLPDICRFAVAADPQMATLALIRGVKPRQEPSAEPGKAGHVGWHELLAADWEKAFAFYAELFGWQKVESNVGPMGTYQQFCAGATTIGGMFTKSASLPFPFWLYYLNVADIEATAKSVEAAGGQILDGPACVPSGAWIAHCMDPQGATFALLERRSRKAIGYFESVALRDSSGQRKRRWSW